MSYTIFKYQEDEIWRQAGRRLVEKLKESVGKKRKTLLLLSGGSVVESYRELVRELPGIKGAGKYSVIGQVDERYHPKDGIF